MSEEDILLTHELIMTSLIKHQQPHYKCILYAMTIFGFIVAINYLFKKDHCCCQGRHEQPIQQNNNPYLTQRENPYIFKELQLIPNYY
jgi:hypothetical protein